MRGSSLFSEFPPDSAEQLRMALQRGLANGTGAARIFFRADDIGAPGRQFSQLIELFTRHRLPLCLAVVPTWLTKSRWDSLQSLTGPGSSQWCWHQHGWLHRNHERTGKKQEFGTGRPAAAQVADLMKGKERLEDLMGNDFSPFFTPPWNRCSSDSLEGLKKLGFTAVSRSSNARPETPDGLPDLQVSIDLHTRKETEPQQAFNALLREIEQSVSSSTAGVMIHHQRMDTAAVAFLDSLLEAVAENPSLQPVLFAELTEE